MFNLAGSKSNLPPAQIVLLQAHFSCIPGKDVAEALHNAVVSLHVARAGPLEGGTDLITVEIIGAIPGGTSRVPTKVTSTSGYRISS